MSAGRVRGTIPKTRVSGERPPAAGKSRLFRGLLALGILCLAGCGYRLHEGPGTRFSEPGIVVDLRPFANASQVPDAGAFLAGRIREEMGREGFRGRFSRSGADYIVEGTVREVREEVVSHGADQFALGYRLTLQVDIRVVEVTHGRLLWREEGMAEWAPFYAGADFQYTESNRRMAFEETCRRIGRRIGQTLRMIL